MLQKLFLLLTLMLFAPIFGALEAQSRDQIRITGSSSVFPFATTVAEEFGRSSRFKSPIVEGIGTGGGLKLFCNGLGAGTPDIVNASRPIKPSELAQCRRNGVTDIIEVKFGYDGIVIASSKSAPHFRLTLRDLYLALAANVPAPGTDGSGPFIPNPYIRWNEINSSLPDQIITILGPPPTSGTRDAFNESVMTAGCITFLGLKDLQVRDPLAQQRRCQAIREDGVYVESGENDNLIVQKLLANDQAVGIFAFSFLDQNNDVLQAADIAVTGDDFVTPTFDDIASGRYPIYRSLFFYVKKAHIQSIPGIQDFLEEFTSDQALGDFGYLTDRGLIPLLPDERAEYRQVVNTLTIIPKG